MHKKDRKLTVGDVEDCIKWLAAIADVSEHEKRLGAAHMAKQTIWVLGELLADIGRRPK